ncbi:DUF262 domain-containing protein [Mesorhizobium sp. M7A.F.Ca.CA.001.09.2.1]|uniref:DUF262 domain-containing protein n=5 Tax=Mesorhizobium TaxID=68287 RepID=A0AB38T804_9HYPH|nr:MULTISPECIES: DUF262 domain-containing protein [Mesorhizobium]RUY52674.1 DUF262 domain-containing protein [Mesorhizobium sp. M7A.F.Ca.CA.001.13.2.1]MDF3217940.1 DUF262 domain-containing protein [Mesorhizobium ciceri]RUY74162.1 DUF262 domain-containing protein [Mesorhizobium sp. M7A.F.Ca.CA.001.05.1.1]RUY75050.1 DUF262 domain-containing protein [Mesorhizobium sp. M7A.F.Ca.CA.001.09.2.1]RUZ03418.1 DUF262 domain-containing protein [Mesorhizobium sp. M7A.F.Ca.CA.001.04.2.1]
MYKPGGTIAEVLGRIQTKSYVLPAIQREFVWKPEQIERLFDSLMQGYPFGTFLFWKVEAVTSGKFKFYDFVLNYHQRDAAHCPELGKMHHQSVTAVLDGQQRLTALNIGLRGSMAIKQPNKWWTNPDAFPVRTLRLDLLAPPSPDEDGIRYRFKFLDDQQAARDEGAHWFLVPDILGMKDGPAMLSGLRKRGLDGDPLERAYEVVDRLHRVVHSHNLVNYYEEETQDLERVLNIFIRLNSGGTILSYSDLLLSIAVAQWKQVDARAEIHKLVDELNHIGSGFALSQDFVLKAGLMLADIASVGFKVENFTTTNMLALETNWFAIRAALVRTVELASSFGLNGQTLRADSALLPIAYYLYRRNAPANYVTHSQFAGDRAAIRDWLVRSIVKASGIWGSGLDTLLTALREVVQANDPTAFPVGQLRQVMSQRGKSLTFEPAEIEDLLHMEYGDKRTFPLLSLLFPFVDLRNQFHVDHIYPISRFTPARLQKQGFDEIDVEVVARHANTLPNLQLLEGAINNEKRAAMPMAWLSAHLPDPTSQLHYRTKHELGELAADLQEFETFYAARQDRLRMKLTELLGNPSAASAPSAAAE